MEQGNNTSISICDIYGNKESTFATTLKLMAYTMAFVVAIVGNVFVINIVFRKSNLRTTTNIFIANMALSDVVLSVFLMPSTMYTIASHNYGISIFKGVAGIVVCKVFPFLQGLFIAVSILTVLVLAADRFLAIVYPFQKIICKRKAKLLILIVYVIAILFNAPVLYAMNYYEKNDRHYCYENWEPHFDHVKATRTYTIVLFVFLYACPLLMVIFFYGAVIRELWKGKVKHNNTLAFRENKSVLKMVLTITIAFAVCWLPTHVIMFLSSYPPSKFIFECGIDPVFFFTGWFMAHLNSSINPIIYFIHAESFRVEAKKTIRPLLRVFLRGQRSVQTSFFYRKRTRDSQSRSSSVYYSINRSVQTEQSVS